MSTDQDALQLQRTHLRNTRRGLAWAGILAVFGVAFAIPIGNEIHQHDYSELTGSVIAVVVLLSALFAELHLAYKGAKCMLTPTEESTTSK